MTRIGRYIGLAALAFALVWMWQSGGVRDVVAYIENGEILTFEARFTPEQIMQAHAREILGAKNQRAFKDSQLTFYPYLLLDVKYPLPDKKSQEGVILWSMVDGEMVINTDSWEKTHGFEDAVNANASPTDFKILRALAKNQGLMTLQQLQKALHLEAGTIAPWIDSAREKHLIVQRGNEIQLHFQNPKILVTPSTKMNEWFVTKPYSEAKKLARTYSKSQIERTAQAAFGHGFTIRNTREIFLPVYCIETMNADGSVLTTYWNALNGNRIPRTIRG